MTAWIPIKTMTVGLEVQRVTSSATTPDDAQFHLWVERATGCKEMPPAGTEYALVIRIVDEQEGQRFNSKYRSANYATNVLSFPPQLPEGLPAEFRQSQLGDLLMCAPVVAREAMEQGKPETNHWAHLTIHGVLHLLGYDHEQSADALAMEALETDILAALNIPAPYQTE